MRKVITYGSICILLLLSAVLYKFCSVIMADSVDYTPSDWLAYRLLTPNEIKNAPHFSDVVMLHFRAADGPSPQSSQIEYAGQADIVAIQRYLVAIGYHETDDPVMGKMWIKGDSDNGAFITQTTDSTKLTFIE
ncbi:hypothetical protein Q5705_11275 [Kosakonia sp. H02]|nr:hypothetical protein Q5705_11275 [Kosakonia sp. H02]